MRTVNFSDARNNLKAVLDRVVDDADVTIIHRRDADDVVVMSLAEWNSWQETNYLLSSPANAKRLLEAIARLDAGEGEYHELIEPGASGVHEERAAYRSRTRSKKAPSKKRTARK
ncbi:MAG: type II toxin-antitoxin system prevent-host-death family antitoxin [Proteobacteria bacterium]|nr:type II toxin-antitoxin system prevent-host-death family antitoxin [Pseudomonadota bacterium]